jgi:hypothetical protein
MYAIYDTSYALAPQTDFYAGSGHGVSRQAEEHVIAVLSPSTRVRNLIPDSYPRGANASLVKCLEALYSVHHRGFATGSKCTILLVA